MYDVSPPIYICNQWCSLRFCPLPFNLLFLIYINDLPNLVITLKSLLTTLIGYVDNQTRDSRFAIIKQNLFMVPDLHWQLYMSVTFNKCSAISVGFQGDAPASLSGFCLQFIPYYL